VRSCWQGVLVKQAVAENRRAYVLVNNRLDPHHPKFCSLVHVGYSVSQGRMFWNVLKHFLQ
jgi:hypothetical protein